uniref:Uncharacterized protein n=1 Tax=viral metagenome TaxID=1070528 RepID=A0A2V0RMT6_9ZZZZ
MSEVTATYKGKLPRPAKTQSIKEFEDEEIKPDPEYTEFKSVADILAQPEYFKVIIDQPEFQEMLKREEQGSDDKETSSKEGAKAPDQKEKVVKAEEEPKAIPDAEVDAPTSIDVVMVPSLEEIAPMSIEAEPSDPKVSVFEPDYLRKVNPLVTPVSIDVTHGLATLTNNGVDDLFTQYSGDRMTKKGKKIFKWLQQFRPQATVTPLKYDSATGLVSRENHAYVLDESVSGSSARTHEYELSRIHPKVVEANPDFMNRLVLEPNLPDELAQDNDTRLIDLSIEPRAYNSQIKSAEVIINPYRTPLLLRDLKAYRHMTMRFNDWKMVHARHINNVFYNYVRERNAKERDEVTYNHLTRTMYDRFVVGGGGSNSQSYYFNIIPNMRHPIMYESVLNRSFMKATDAMSTIMPSQRSISMNITNRQASNMLLNLTAIQPSDGANFMKHLGAFLLGGKRRALEVDIDDGATKSPLLNALSSFASLTLLDRNLVDERSYRQLLMNVLLPFYDEFKTVRDTFNDDEGRRPRNLETSKDLHTIANDVIRDGAKEGTLPKVTKVYDLSGKGRIKAREARLRLINLLTRVDGVHYTQMREHTQMFKNPAAEPFMPFIPRDDVVDIILFGTRGDGDESKIHETATYRPAALAMANLVEEFADLLSLHRQFEGVGVAMAEAMKTKSHLPKSLAIFTDAFIHGSTISELLPATTRIDGRVSFESVMLPFDGALSFILYGIGSSEMSESNNEFIRFKALNVPTLPSLYPVYLYFERCIAQSAFSAFLNADDDILITHHDLVVDACIDALKVYFTSVDPASRDRISFMFEEREMLRGDRSYELPTLLKSSIFSDHRYAPLLGARGNISLPGSFMTNDEIHENVNYINPYESAIDAVDKAVYSMYIDFEPLEPINIETYNHGHSLVYTKDYNDGEYLDLKEIIINAQYIDSDELSLDMVKNLAELHIRRRGREEFPQRPKGVRIAHDDMRSNFKFVEHKGLSDIIATAPKIKIDRSSRNLDFKFEVGEISVYYHRLTDRVGGLNAMAIEQERTYLQGFMTYVGIKKSVIQDYLINFDHADPMDPASYKSSGIPGLRDRLDNPSSISNIRVRDGKGVTYAGRLSLSTRESENISIVKTLSTKEEFGQQD